MTRSRKPWIILWPTNKERIMIEMLIWLAVGAFVGWNFPQPQFAKNIQAKVMAMFKKEPKEDTSA